MHNKIEFLLNGKSVKGDSKIKLADYIRDDMNLKGTKIACREGDCGACTVIVGENHGDIKYKAITSCITPLHNVRNSHVVTIEGLNLENQLNLVQSAFVRYNATQCGFCTPGFIMSLTAYLLDGYINVNGALDSIDGNICRCTGYLSIVRAIEDIVYFLDKKGINKTTGIDRIKFLVSYNVIPQSFLDGYTQLNKMQSVSIDVIDDISDQFKTITGEFKIVSGATDLNVQIPELLLHSNTVFVNYPELNYIHDYDEYIEIGASTTFAKFVDSKAIKSIIPAIDEYSKIIASTQIRNSATIAGNIVNASPIADLVIMLLPLYPELKLLSKNSFRYVPLNKFYLGYKQLDLSADEIIFSIKIKKPKYNLLFNFEKISKRRVLDIASVNSAIAISLDENNHINSIAISAGGVSPVPKILDDVCDYLLDKELNEDNIISALKLLNNEISPINDVRGSKAYKSLALRNLIYAHFIKLFPHLNLLEVIR